MPTSYLLSSSPLELERLRLQARVWEPHTEALLDAIGLEPGWSCIDLGCGAMGILGSLSRRVGASGRVIGVELDPLQTAAARAFLQDEALANVEVVERDAYATGLPDESFDLVHVRFVFAPAGKDADLLAEMLRLVRPGGVLAIQEPDSVSWMCSPSHPAWTRLTSVIRTAFSRAGGDFDAGRRTYAMLRRAGVQDVRIRAAVLALEDGHPYRRLPIQLAVSLRAQILRDHLVDEGELEDLISDCERIAVDPDTHITTFIVNQVWGRTSCR